MPRGRNKKDGVCHTYQIKLYLWEGEDDDLIALLESIPDGQRASRIKFALRNGNALENLAAGDAFNDDDDDFDLDDLIYG